MFIYFSNDTSQFHWFSRISSLQMFLLSKYTFHLLMLLAVVVFLGNTPMFPVVWLYMQARVVASSYSEKREYFGKFHLCKA